MPVWLIILLGLLVFGAAAILSALAAQRRREALARIAGQLGLRYSEKDPYGISSRYTHFTPLSKGDERYAFNVIEGTYRGWPLLCFDYHYETHSTDSKGRRTTTHHYVSCVLAPLEAWFKRVVIRPESILDKLAAIVGLDDIDFESAEFSRRFFVKSQDRKFTYDIVHPRAMELLLKHADDGYCLELAGGGVLFHRTGQWKPERVPGALDFAADFLDLIPPYVWEQVRVHKEA